MSREVNISDVLHHVETDLKDVLSVLAKSNVYEVMLNPYEREDGQYEGHVWYEEAGIGMKRLTIDKKMNFKNPPTPKLNDTVIFKRLLNGTILSYQILKSEAQTLNKEELFNIFSRVLIFTLSTDEDDITYFNHEENYKLNEFALNIQNGKLNIKENLDITTGDLTTTLAQINKQLKQFYFSFELSYIKIDHEDLVVNKMIPQYFVSRKFVKMESTKVEQIINTLASASSILASERDPVVECQIPYYKHRFTGLLKPIVKFPSFTIRKHSSQILTLDEYVSKGIMPQKVAILLRDWIGRRYNILVAGGTGSGKTTLLNSLLLETSKICPEHRAVVIEDTPEIQCKLDNFVSLVKSEDVNIPQLLNVTLRLRPDRIIIGELRGKEAYTLLKAWMTGHPGGFTTIHADGAKEAIYRFEQCIKESDEVDQIPREQIGLAIQGIISVQKVTKLIEKNGIRENIVMRKITALREIRGYKTEKQIYADTWHHKDPEAFGEIGLSDDEDSIDLTDI
ncbi:MAG: Flp pilus assembly complex ATPase component TadA [Burkholderiales bacterium]|nr:Flp pilus assembly complex ATPase component TadA [Burkholderiales bacterium]